jgi:transposase-like protein
MPTSLRVRWYITYRLSYRDLVAMMAERGVEISHTTILRWVIRYVPEFEKRWNRHARRIGSSWRVDETYVSIRGKWHYLHRAVDKQGNRAATCSLARRASNSFTARLRIGLAAICQGFAKKRSLTADSGPTLYSNDGLGIAPLEVARVLAQNRAPETNWGSGTKRLRSRRYDVFTARSGSCVD